MADLISMLAAVAGQAGEEADEDFNQTVLLLHGDGTNGAQNNTFLDSSTNNFTITRNGNTTQGTFSPFSVGAGEWSNYFDVSGDYLRYAVNTSSQFSLGTSDFTCEAWVYPTAFDAGSSIIAGQTQTSNTALWGFVLYLNASGQPGVLAAASSGNYDVNFLGTAILLNAWTHLAVTRSGNTFTLWRNGVSDGTATSSATISQDTTANYGGWDIGGSPQTGQSHFGYISNHRLVVGTAVYTSAFTPPTAPLTAITNTSLLTCQSNRFVDNSTNAFAITRNGNVRVTPFSPFAPSAAYSASTNGGSGYFDGTGDYISVAYDATAFNFGTGNVTIEAWVYYLSVATGGIVTTVDGAGNSSGGVLLYLSAAGTLRAYGPSVSGTTTTTVNTGQWYHIALTRSTNTWTLWKDGVSQGTFTDSGTFNPGATRPFYIGGSPSQSSNSYLQDFRIVKGTALYTAAFTPPTAPLTAVSNTQLLCNFTNAGIFDNTGKNNLETVGNAQIDTGTKKYGTGSMEFDGTGDWLLMANTPDQQLGTGNFTIEFWVYLATGDIGSARGLVAKGTSTTGFLVSLDSSQKVVFTFTTSTITSSGAITTNAWNHIAIVRSGTGSNQTKIYIGGTNDGTGTVSTNFNQTSVMYVGCNRTAGDPMKGFIDDLRITKGVARYTANFTAPTKAFPDQ